jgi:integrase
MRTPFSLFTRVSPSGKRVWYAKFWDQETERYIAARTTGIVFSGRRGNRDTAAKVAESILADIRRTADPFFLDYVASFWADDSAYIKQKRIADKHPLSVEYIKNNQSAIRLHLMPYKPFKGLLLSKLRAGIMNDWQLWALEKGNGARTVNATLQAVRVAVRHAVERGDLLADPLASVKKATETPRERGVLLPSEVAALVGAPEADPRVKAAVLLAALGGLRRGEVRGLQWGDIDEKEGIINLSHNYIDEEGVKECKWGSSRRAALHSAISAALEEVRAVSPAEGPTDYVLFDIERSDRPISETVLKRGFWRMLRSIGIDAEGRKSRNLTFHGLRHSFVTIARISGLPDVTVQALAGHKSARMMETYSHAGMVIDFLAARTAMERALEPKNQKAAGGES